MHLKKILAGAIAVLAIAFGVAYAADVRTNTRYFSREQQQAHVGTAAINSASATWTNWTALITITPNAQHSLMNCRVAVDLDKSTSGWATNATSATITFTVARKIDGTNWRVANNIATTTLSGTNSSGQGIELAIGDVGPTETVALYAKVSSATGLAVTNFPYVVYYEAGVPAVLTLAN